MSDEEVSGIALLAYMAVLVGGYMTVVSQPIIPFILGAILIPLGFAIGIVYADGIVKGMSELTDRMASALDQKWSEFRNSEDESSEETSEESENPLMDTYDSTYDAKNGEADVVSAKVDPEQESVIVINFMTASEKIHTTEVEIPPAGEWNRQHKLPTLCAYLDVSPVWDYDQLSESDKKIQIKKSKFDENEFVIDYQAMRSELPNGDLAKQSAKQKQTNLEKALEVN